MNVQSNTGAETGTERMEEAKIDRMLGEELTDEQLLQMAEGSCSWGANCNHGC